MMKRFTECKRGMGIGGWLTNYKRFNVLPDHRKMDITIGDYEHFAEYITERDVAYIASLGMDHIRLGFDQIVLEEYDRPGVYRECTMAHLDAFIGWCQKYDLGVVLNMHKAIGNYCDIEEKKQLLDEPELQERFIALWVELEKRYADIPEVAFELLNEVRRVDPEKWNRLAEATVTALHQINPTRDLIIGSVAWNAASTLKDLRVFDDPHVHYTFHMYAPHEFTHQRGVLQASTLYYNRKMPYPCDDIERYREYHRVVANRENTYAQFTRMDETFIAHEMMPAVEFMRANPGKLLWCGEFGTIRHADIRWREAYMRDVIAFLKAHDIPYCVWNYLSTPNDGNRFSLVDDDTRTILSDEMAKIIRGEG